MSTTPIVKEILVNASPEKVWKAITDKEEMKVWYFDLLEFKPEVGFRFEFWGETPDCKYLHLCEIKEVIPLQKIRYSWRYDGYLGDSMVTFEITPQGNQTLLRLIHEGLHTFPSDNPDFKKGNFDGGWESIIKESFRNFVEH